MTLDGYRLMIPGPVQLAPEVLAELSRPIVPHYGADWTRYYNETLDLLREVFQTTGDIFPIPGSGSAALEAGLRMLLGPDRHLLILSNGFFGDRLAAIAQSLGGRVTVERFPVERPIGTAQLTAALARAENATSVAVVHSESSSGLLNRVEDLAAACRQRDLLLFVDAISSLGGVDLDMDTWGIDLCASASQKCLEAPPGIGLIAVGNRAWAHVSSRAPGSWYLGLGTWREYAESGADWHPFPVTMAVPTFRALRVGVERAIKEGLDRRIARHAESAHHVRSVLSSLGLDPVFTEADASPTVLAIHGRPDLGADDVVDRLRTEHKILIARGLGEFAGRAFRVGNMGQQATREEMDILLAAIDALVSERRGKDAG